MTSPFRIGNRDIGPGNPVYVIAELSANHNQNFDKAAQIIHAAKDAGADAIKIQTYTADTLTIDSDQPYFRISSGTVWEGKNLHALYQEAFTPWDWQPKLKKIANDLGLDFFSTPFDASAVAFLEQMEVPAYKIASFEAVDIPLLREVGATRKPVIMSTGMCSIDEIDEAVTTLRDAGCPSLALLKCTSAYPAPADEMHLATIPALRERFDCAVGLSDHTLGIAVPIAAVALGANIIEKHVTLSRADGGPDSEFSLEPAELREMVAAIRTAEKAVGTVHFGLSEREQASRVFRRSLFVVADVKAGETFTAANVRSIRPGHGLHTRHLPEIIGRTAARDIQRGTPLSWDLVIS